MEMNGQFTVSLNMTTILWDVFFKVTQEMHLLAKNRIQMSAEYNQQKHFCRHCSYQHSTSRGLVSLTYIFSPIFPFPSMTPWLHYGTSQVICTSKTCQSLSLMCHQMQEVLNSTVHDSTWLALGAGLAFTTELWWNRACSLFAECAHCLYINVRPETTLIWK